MTRTRLKHIAKFFLIPLALILVTVAMIWLFSALKPEPPESQAKERSWPVRTVTLEAAARAPQLRLLGRVETPFRSTLTSAVTADVAAIPVLEGKPVNTGDIIVQLDESEVALLVAQREADVAELQAQRASEQNQYKADQRFLQREEALVEIARRALEREQQLVASNLTSQSRTDQARQSLQTAELSLISRELAVANHKSQMQSLEARLQRANSLLKQARLDLERTAIKAPFDGVITGIEVSPGERVRAGEPLVSLYAIDQLEVRAQLPMRWTQDAAQTLAASQPLSAATQIAGQTYTLELARLSGQVNAGAGGVDGLFRFVGAQPPAALNRTLDLLLDLSPRSRVFSLPVSALYDEATVYRIAGDRLESLQVTRVGDRFENGQQRLLVQSAQLDNGDQVLSTQLPNAINGLKVDVVTPGPDA
ncbi:efflux RND transporter periplasmic adaptor subunit [Marinobacter caseinilyticus]|uniref:efflux RND transporter periplasmic adaptor subunit n=1 Tax=Marinobacter caseinilyticus TaxID=2692195 RepID=UPI0014086182|nr:HlyD family efflux transporter periplasmic adaptor subunit [Marinobacter caseinilyticus]